LRLDHPGCLSPEGRFRGLGLVEGIELYRGDDIFPLIRLGIDTRRPQTSFLTFTLEGGSVAWGNADGTVTVADIAEVQRRLAAVELGW
jgi:hypothetical protein